MLEQVNRNIKYLGAQIAKTAIAEMREVSYKLIEEQTKAKMLAEASQEYTFAGESPIVCFTRRRPPPFFYMQYCMVFHCKS